MTKSVTERASSFVTLPHALTHSHAQSTDRSDAITLQTLRRLIAIAWRGR